MLEITDLHAGYGRGEVLHGINLEMSNGEVLAILGPNGAGKSTLLRTIVGLLSMRSGTIRFDGRQLKKHTTVAAVEGGIVLVPEGRQIFATMTVHENLLMGAFVRRDSDIDADLEVMFEYFPDLRDKQARLGSALSGGQQQMLAIARGLMARPRLLLLDEPSLGLSPLLTEGLAPLITRLATDFDTSVLIVEQNANLALSVADRACLLQSGKIDFVVSSDEMAHRLEHENIYLGAAG